MTPRPPSSPRAGFARRSDLPSIGKISRFLPDLGKNGKRPAAKFAKVWQKSPVFAKPWQIALLLPLLLAACTALPPGERKTTLAVPFIAQPDDRCGPVALAMVEGYYGRKPDLPALESATLIPALGGTIPDLLVQAARDDGFSADLLHLSPDQLFAELRIGRPLVLLLAPDPDRPEDPRGHFIVATGCDPHSRALRAHTGDRKNVWLPAGEWLPRYQAAGSTVVFVTP